MYTITALLDLAKKETGLPSDNQLALKLGRTNITQYRTKGVIPDDSTAIKLAELCGMKPEMVIATCHAAKAKTKEEKNIWNHFYKMAAAAAVTGLMVSGGVSVVPQDANAQESVALSQIENNKSNAMDIM